jgi:hypothetical protein
MKKPLTNNIYCVTLKKVANIYVDADSPEEAMKIASRWTDSVDDDEFEDSEVEVDCCDSYPDEATDSYMETIYTQDEALEVDEYIERYEAQDPEEVARGGWDMTNQLELPLTNIEP